MTKSRRMRVCSANTRTTRRRDYSSRVHDPRSKGERPEPPVCTCEFLSGFGVDMAGCELHGGDPDPESGE